VGQWKSLGTVPLFLPFKVAVFLTQTNQTFGLLSVTDTNHYETVIKRG
jgi:hypothetical protein